MASYTWPLSLPQFPLYAPYAEEGGLLIHSSQPDAGLAITEYRGTLPTTMPLTYVMDDVQFQTFLAFVNSTIKGVAPINLPNPDKHTAGYIDVRLVPQGRGILWRRAPNGIKWNVSIQIEVMP